MLTGTSQQFLHLLRAVRLDSLVRVWFAGNNPRLAQHNVFHVELTYSLQRNLLDLSASSSRNKRYYNFTEILVCLNESIQRECSIVWDKTNTSFHEKSKGSMCVNSTSDLCLNREGPDAPFGGGTFTLFIIKMIGILIWRFNHPSEVKPSHYS